MTTTAIAVSTMTPQQRADILRKVSRVANVMDTSLRVPFTSIRFGADTVVGLIPGVGDVVSLGVSVYALNAAYRLGASNAVMGKMLVNIAVDAGLGSVPLAGDLFDMFFKSNTRNLKLLLEHFGEDEKIES